MKQLFKKIVTAVLAVSMICAMGFTAFAANEPTTGLLKVNEDKGNTYTAYQVMTSEVTGYKDTAKTQPVYTYAVNSAFADFFTSAESNYRLNAQNEITLNDTVIAGDGLSANTNTSEASKLANALEQYAIKKGISGTTVSGDGANLAIGYYVVAETASAAGTAVASKPILVDLRDAVTVTPKDDSIDLEKKIVENDKKVDANNVSIGDTVTYEVTTAVPTYEANVDKTKLSYVLTDDFSAGLTYNKDVKVFAGETELTAGTEYTITETDSQFVITFTQDAIYDNQGAAITLKYSAVLNPKAVVNSTEGNPNDIKLEYTNNPNQSDSKDTLKDETITYTYGFQIHKVDKNDDTKDMSGATFEIKDSDGTVVGNFSYDENGDIVAGENVVIDGNYATVTGLDAGIYTITETKAPDGYSLLGGDVTVVIADQGESAGNAPTGVATITVSGAGNAVAEVKTNTTDGSIDVVVKIENIAGISLPETGSKTAMYCLFAGGILVLLGGVFLGMIRLVSRKRR